MLRQQQEDKVADKKKELKRICFFTNTGLLILGEKGVFLSFLALTACQLSKIEGNKETENCEFP